MILNEDVKDGIRELINIGVGRAAGLMNEMTGAHVSLAIPELKVVRYEELNQTLQSLDSDISTVHMEYEGDMKGICALIMPYQSAIRFVQLLTGDDEDSADMDIMRAETLREVGNIIINAIMGSITNVIGRSLSYFLPVYTENSLSHITLSGNSSPDDPVIFASTRFLVTSLSIEGDIMLLLDTVSIRMLSDRIMIMTGGDDD